ncbi:YncE family protein [Steroidobacter flavus]|uniref:YncE family protein n=1 Tax=Steroidobacter flavus TaxID=1842136 RepID=A0ABV8SM26_9GAMM
MTSAFRTFPTRFATALLATGALVAAHEASAADAPAPYAVIQHIAAKDGGYDYVSIDSAAHRLYMARNDGVMTVDLKTNKVTPRFVAGDEVAAVLIIPDTSLMLSTNWASGKATLFDRLTGQIKAQIPVGKGPDAALYDPASKLAFVMNGESNDVTLVDLTKAAAVATIPVGGKPEAAASDGHGRVYLNIEDTAEIVVIDSHAHKVVGRYAMKGCKEPTGLAFDPTTGLLISACHNSVAKLIDARTGADKGSAKIGADADGAIFDATKRLVFIPCNSGTMTVLKLDMNGKAQPVQQVQTHEGARTAALDPTTDRLYLPSANFVDGKGGEREAVAGTFEVLVVGRK